MKMTKKIVVMMLMAGSWLSCERQDHSGQLTVTVASDMECKSNSSLKTSDPPPENSCVSYSYDNDNSLTMTHYNSGFNCCPEKFSVDIEVKGDSLIIRENELKHGCKCNCLFHLELKVNNLPAGTYHVRFVEPYVNQTMPQLIFDLDLKNEPQGQFCVTRPERWWG